MKHSVPTEGLPIEHSLFAVPGLHCAGCIAKIEAGLAAHPQVAAARVNFTAKQVAVDHQPELRVPDLQAALERLGFEAHPVSADLMLHAGAESRRLTKAVAVAGFASMNVMLLSVSVWSGATGATRDLFHLLAGAIAIPTVAFSGQTFFRSAWQAVRHGRTNMDVPISIGVILVTALSLFETLTSGPHAYFDGAVMLLFFLLVGRLLDSVMRDRARAGVAALLKQTAPGASVIGEDGRAEWVAAADLQPGMRIIVPMGERVAADGVVVAGTSSIDRSLLTGESMPQPVAPGSEVNAGTLNLDAPLTVRVTAAGPDTALADIARLMEEAGQGRSRYVRLADRAARWYAPAVHTLAISAFCGWMVAGAGWHSALMIAAAVLIITCPCALGLAVPAAQIVAAGTLMRAGVLVKDGSALERLAEADAVLLDKTGTLTLGRPEPANLEVVPPDQAPLVLALAQASSHPLSRALARRLVQAGVRPAILDGTREEPGFGMRGRLHASQLSLGRPSKEQGDAPAVAFRIDDGAETVIRFDDAVRPDAGTALRDLAGLGLQAAIASGDRPGAVAPLAQRLGVPFEAGMTPQDKLAAIARLSGEGRKVLMVGDGLNDGPALAAGHVSLAPASASDVGQTAADAVFLGDSLLPLAGAVKVARRTMRIVRQNLAIAILYNALAIPLALAGKVTPLVAALAMSGSSIIVVANALRLKGNPQ